MSAKIAFRRAASVNVRLASSSKANNWKEEQDRTIRLRAVREYEFGSPGNIRPETGDLQRGLHWVEHRIEIQAWAAANRQLAKFARDS